MEKCQNCQADLEGRLSRRYCSDACRQSSYRKRKQAQARQRAQALNEVRKKQRAEESKRSAEQYRRLMEQINKDNGID